MYLEYHTVVVLCYFFLIWREIVFCTYVLSVQYSCAVVSVFVVAGKLIWCKISCWIWEFSSRISCFVWIYNHTVTIVLQKYQKLCLISQTILIGFLYFTENPDRGFLFLRNTLLLYSLSPYRQTECRMEKQIHLLCVGWRNLFFQLCCCVSVLFWQEIGFGFTYYLCT